MKRRIFLNRMIAMITVMTMPTFLRSQEKTMTQNELTEKISELKNLNDLSILLKSLEGSERNLKISGTWGVGKVLSHCAQSVRYSINGFPDMKSSLFRGTVGSLAFSVFSFRKKMSHGLEEPIPGAEPIDNNISFKQGSKELLDAIDQFQLQKSENLKPHFAYGTLNKQDFDEAHTLHFKNHFEQITLS